MFDQVAREMLDLHGWLAANESHGRGRRSKLDSGETTADQAIQVLRIVSNVKPGARQPGLKELGRSVKPPLSWRQVQNVLDRYGQTR
jgi:hypothetical protein